MFLFSITTISTTLKARVISCYGPQLLVINKSVTGQAVSNFTKLLPVLIFQYAKLRTYFISTLFQKALLLLYKEQ